MAESKVKRDNFITIQGFMLTELGLKGNELIIYAIIYGFSQSGEGQNYTGSLQYLADWTNSTKRSVINNLNSLVEKGYITKQYTVKNGVKYCEYAAYFTGGENISQGSETISLVGEKSTPEGSEKNSPNNIDINNIENIIDDNIAAVPPHQQIVDMYISICKSYPKLRTMPDSRKKAIKARLKKYTIDDFKELFEKAEASTWLKSKHFGFDWLINESNMAKVLEGNYDDKPKKTKGRKEIVPDWATRQDYDFDELEKDIVANSPELSKRAEDLKRRLSE